MFKKKGLYLVIAILAIAIFLIQFDLVNNTRQRSLPVYRPDGPARYIVDKDTLMTYVRFTQIEDSIKRVNEWREIKNRGRFRGGTETSFIGVASIDDCDNCLPGKKSSTNKYYLVLPGYALHDSGYTSFYVDSDKYYVQSGYWERQRIRDGKVIEQVGNYRSKQVPFRFSIDEYGQKGQVLIPVTQKTYRILSPVIQVGIVLLILFMLHVVIMLPAAVLIRISTGRVFTPANIRNLNFMAWTLTCYPLMEILIRFILKFSFPRYITSDLDFQWPQILYEYRYMFVAGIVVFIIAMAFKKGYNLQKDQDLTI